MAYLKKFYLVTVTDMPKVGQASITAEKTFMMTIDPNKQHELREINAPIRDDGLFEATNYLIKKKHEEEMKALRETAAATMSEIRSNARLEADTNAVVAAMEALKARLIERLLC